MSHDESFKQFRDYPERVYNVSSSEDDENTEEKDESDDDSGRILEEVNQTRRVKFKRFKKPKAEPSDSTEENKNSKENLGEGTSQQNIPNINITEPVNQGNPNINVPPQQGNQPQGEHLNDQDDHFIHGNFEGDDIENNPNMDAEEIQRDLEPVIIVNDNGEIAVNPMMTEEATKEEIAKFLKQKDDDMKEITQKLSELSFKREGHIPIDEQAQHIKLLELAEYQVRTETNKKIQKLLSVLAPAGEDAQRAVDELKEEVKKEVSAQERVQISKYAEIKKAQNIASKYKKSIKKPHITEAPENYQYTPQRTSPKEIICVTGKFNPSDPKADFNHMWSKLTGYGQLHHFKEEEYIHALRYILEGDAYEAYINMVEDNHGIDYIINYFSHVHGRKRSILQDRNAVDNFTRHKNESLDVCMHRSLIAIDKLAHLYSKTAWPEIRNSLRRGILAQVIHPDTWKYVRYEENEILEKTGLHVEMDKVIEMADRYETFNNKVPTKDIATAFQVASGGFSMNVNHLKDENFHLKKERFDDRQKITELIHEVLANPVQMMSGEERSRQSRDNRMTDRMNERKQRRDAAFDKNRSISQEPAAQRSATPTRVTFKKSPGPHVLPPSLARRREERERARSASAGSREPSRSPDTRVVPYTPPRLNQNPDQSQRKPDQPYDRRGYNERGRDYSSDRRNGGNNYQRNNSYDRNYRRNYSNDRGRQGYSNDRNYRRGYSNDRNYRRDGSQNRNYQGYQNQRSNYRSQSVDSQNGRSNSYGRYKNQRYNRSNSRDRNYGNNRGNNYGYKQADVSYNYGNQRNGTRTPPPMEKSVLVTINGATFLAPSSENQDDPPHDYHQSKY